MRPVEQLVHARTRVRDRYALMPLEGFPMSRLPANPKADVRVLASPALGSGFVEMLIDLPAGQAISVGGKTGVETFYFVLAGEGAVDDRPIHSGTFGLTPPAAVLEFTAQQSLQFLILEKRHEPATGIAMFDAIHSHESTVKKEVWADNPHSLLQTLIPDEMRFDIAMNIFTFDPGFGLPIVETHVMEHGLYFLQGKGVYFLDGEWMEVEKDDFIWMGPFCPQSFYATGPTPSRYLYYKNVNRDIPL